MTRVDGILLETLAEMGDRAPSKFVLISSAGVQYEHALNRINRLVTQGVLEIYRGPRGAHIVVRRTHAD